MDTERIHRYGTAHQVKWGETVGDLQDSVAKGDASEIQRYAIQLANEKAQVACYTAFLRNQKRFGDDEKAAAVTVRETLDVLLRRRWSGDSILNSSEQRAIAEFIGLFEWSEEVSLASLLTLADEVYDDLKAKDRAERDAEQQKHDAEFGSIINPKTGKRLSWQSVRGAVVKAGLKSPNVREQKYGEDSGKVVLRIQERTVDTRKATTEELVAKGYHPENPDARIPYNALWVDTENPELVKKFRAKVAQITEALTEAGFVFTVEAAVSSGWATFKVSGYKVKEG